MTLTEAFEKSIRTAHREGVNILKRSSEPLLHNGRMELEPDDVAVAVERHRWYWRPAHVKVALVAESHVYTSRDDLNTKLDYPNHDGFVELRDAPRDFVRLIYCLGYGQRELLPHSATSQQRKGGTPQYWTVFSELAGTSGSKPQTGQWADRVKWKIETLQALQDRGIWLLDASLHAIYAPAHTQTQDQSVLMSAKGENRISYATARELHLAWWQYYGKPLMTDLGDPPIWCIGKSVYGALSSLETDTKRRIDLRNWMYQPNARKQPNLQQGHFLPDLVSSVNDYLPAH